MTYLTYDEYCNMNWDLVSKRTDVDRMILWEANRAGINDGWVDRQLSDNGYIKIYEYIICKLRNKSVRDSEEERILQKYRKELAIELQTHLMNYCFD